MQAFTMAKLELDTYSPFSAISDVIMCFYNGKGSYTLVQGCTPINVLHSPNNSVMHLKIGG